MKVIQILLIGLSLLLIIAGQPVLGQAIPDLENMTIKGYIMMLLGNLLKIPPVTGIVILASLGGALSVHHERGFTSKIRVIVLSLLAGMITFHLLYDYVDGSMIVALTGVGAYGGERLIKAVNYKLFDMFKRLDYK